MYHRKAAPTTGSMCKGPGVGPSLACLRNLKKPVRLGLCEQEKMKVVRI